MTHSIKQITAICTYPVRHIVLRAGKPIESCQFDGDELASTYHFGYFMAEQLIGVISIFEVGHPTFDHQKSFQIRGMAILAAHQKKGFGEALVLEAEAFCKKQKATLIWFNARSSAVGFYQKMGYNKMGSEFEIKGVGPHFLMFKTT